MATSRGLVVAQGIALVAAIVIGESHPRLAIGRERTTAPSVDEPMGEVVFVKGRTFVRTWCADCHSARAQNPNHARAYRAQRLDSYPDWVAHQSAIRGVLDKWHPDGKVMPPTSAKAQPSDEDRAAILEWIDAGSPNTRDGR